LTVLAVLTDYPELVAGGVASYPVSDLKALTEATHRFEAHYTDTLVAPNDGSPESEAAFRELSPLHRAQQIRSKLLLFHGTEDPVVPISQSDDLVDAVRAVGGSVDYIEFQGEGHGFRQPANVAEEYSRTEAFLERVTQPT
jgi:dipeptidyl aminopeptidase/acylaminoacyl peptidase